MKIFVKTSIAVLLLLLCALPVFAAGGTQTVYDQAQLFTAQEKQELEAYIAAVRQERQIDLVIVTTNSTGNKSVTAYADDFYDEHDFSHNGALLLISMEYRDVYISTSGSMIQTLTDARIDKMINNTAAWLSDGDYARGGVQFIQDCVFYLNGGHNYPAIIGISALIALACGLASILLVRSRYKSPGRQATRAYLDEGKTRFTKNTDIYITSRYSRVPIPRESSGGGGGSSTHMSSGGRSHGGGGGKF